MTRTVYSSMSNNTNIDKHKINKMIFIMNALENGWKIKKVKSAHEKYVFYKKHENKKEMFSDTCLDVFIKENIIT